MGVEQQALWLQELRIHIGAMLTIPGFDNLQTNKKEYSDTKRCERVKEDPFEGLPFKNLAEYLGDQIMPALEAVREEQLKAEQANKDMNQSYKVTVPHVPHVLPFTRWAAQDENFRSTLVVEDDKTQKPRLSWYHPDDTVCLSSMEMMNGWMVMNCASVSLTRVEFLLVDGSAGLVYGWSDGRP